VTWPCQARLAATFSTSLLGEPNDDDVIVILFCVVFYVIFHLHHLRALL
jgi:hypothetical protein